MSACSVTIAGTTIDGDEHTVRELFMAAIVTAKKSGFFALTDDDAIFLSPTSSITIHIPGGFAKENNPQKIVDDALKPPRQAWSLV